MPQLADHRYRGARALVLLHGHHLRVFLTAWRRASASGVAMPPSDDPTDAYLEHTVMHPIRHACQLEELLGERA